jgi:protein phosphatase 2C family protein 2/3
MSHTIHSASLTGARPTNQDAHIEFDNLNGVRKDKARIAVLGVFDGHGDQGELVSEKLAQYYLHYLTDPDLKYPLETETVTKICDKIQKRLAEKRESQQSGSTGLVTIKFVNKDGYHELQTLNTGDCRAMLGRDAIGVQLTRDQKPNSFYERQRIERLLDKNDLSDRDRERKFGYDGHDWRICDLSVARAFGDCYAKPYVTHQPEVFRGRFVKSTDAFLVLACDGVWDVFSTTALADFILERMCPDKNGRPVLKEESSNVAKEVCKEAIKMGSEDNVSCIIMFL